CEFPDALVARLKLQRSFDSADGSLSRTTCSAQDDKTASPRPLPSHRTERSTRRIYGVISNTIPATRPPVEVVPYILPEGSKMTPANGWPPSGVCRPNV